MIPRADLTPSRPQRICMRPMPTLVLPYPGINPVLIQWGPLAIRWYALAYLALRSTLGLLGRRDLSFDLGHRASQDRSAKVAHRSVDHVGALLGDLREEHVPADLRGLRKLGEDGFALVGVIHIEQ
jgi:hypothetical protein